MLGLITKKTAYITLSVVGLTVTAATVGSPAHADTASGNTQANVSVTGEISLTALTNAFTLSGTPGTVAENVGAVTMIVTTNNAAGYSVTVEPVTAAMTGATAGNNETIPTSALNVKETVGGSYTPLIFGTPVQVHQQTTASAPAGDSLSNDYQITVPFVEPDTYTATLEYVATTL